MNVSSSAVSTISGARALEVDARRIIHPQTRLDIHSADNVLVAERASGVRLWDVQGNEWFDAGCGQVNVSFGYGRAEIAAAVERALRDFGFVSMFSSTGHVLAAELAERLAAITPQGIERFFFTTGGSDAMESALKFARYSFAMQGRPEKHLVIGRNQSYHGMTFGATAMTGNPGNWEGYGPMLDGFVHIAQPTADSAEAAAAELEAKIRELGAENVAAFVAEPISLPSGLVIPPDGYWQAVRRICDEHEVLLVVDEVVCGFGRTGTMFGIDQWSVSPDMMVMSKAINNGAIPMGAVGLTDRVAGMLAVPGRKLTHGFTGGGHPAACAAALATLDIIENENILARTKELERLFADRVQRLSVATGRVTGHRGLGGLLAIDLSDDAEGSTPIGPRLVAELRSRRVIIRSFTQNSLFIAPSLTVTESEVDELFAHLEAVLANT